jgi:uncharacterized membrane protein YhaH (DUF805 family)
MAVLVINIIVVLYVALLLRLKAKWSVGRMPWDQFLFSLHGRVTRVSWWLRFVVPVFLILSDFTITVGPGPWTSETDKVLLTGAVAMLTGVLLWPTIAVAVKRCHDRGRSGWFLLIVLIPTLGFVWLMIELGLVRGTSGPNRFGPDPLT